MAYQKDLPEHHASRRERKSPRDGPRSSRDKSQKTVNFDHTGRSRPSTTSSLASSRGKVKHGEDNCDLYRSTWLPAREGPKHPDEFGEQKFKEYGSLRKGPHMDGWDPTCTAKDAYEQPLHQVKGASTPHLYDYLSREWLNYPDKKAHLRRRGKQPRPEAPRKPLEFTGQTEYGRHYQPKQAPRDTYRPKMGSSVPLGGEFRPHTETQDKYPQHPVVPPAPKEKPKWVPNKIPMPNDTTYGTNYQPQDASPPKQYRPKDSLRRPRDHKTPTTEHRRTYVDPEGKGRPEKHSPKRVESPNAPFLGMSCYTKDYPAYKIPPRTKTPKKEKPPARNEPLGSSTYNDDIGHPDDANLNESPPSRPQPRKGNDPGTFETENNHSFRDFSHSPLKDPIPVQPKKGPAPSGPFRGTTENHDKYLPHEPVPPQPRAKPKYQPNKVPLQPDTTYGSNYPKYAAEPRPKGHRPRDHLKPHGPFNPDTESRSNYKGTTGPPARPYTPVVSPVKRPPFQATSEYSKKYIGHGKGDPRRIRGARKIIDMQFVDPSTTYRDGCGRYADEDLASEDSRGYVY